MNRIWADFAGVAGASIIATVADGLVFWMLSSMGLRAGTAAVLAAVVGGIIHFSLCRWGVFRRCHSNIMKSAGQYMVMSGIAALLQGGVVELLVSHTGHATAWTLGKGLIYVVWTFPLSRWVVFKESKS